MAQVTPTPPKGMRDFGPTEMARRQYMFGCIKTQFKRFGFQPLETPAMEKLETLTGKYGEEGDRLIFKVLNSGDFFRSIKGKVDQIEGLDSRKHASLLSEKALKYDLTVPFARYVSQHRHALPLPFRRYQMQPVWRADNPQKGRYREFYQCDADIIGSDSLNHEVELLLLFNEVFLSLGFPQAIVRLNNRKILAGIAEMLGVSDRLIPMTMALDKKDKIGMDGVAKELEERGFSSTEIEGIRDIFSQTSPDLQTLKTLVAGHSTATKGVEELAQILRSVGESGVWELKAELDITLARGLDYYTGAIMEVVIPDSGMGSVAAGGRYDNLTHLFGWEGVSGVGISFGADRLYDLMLQYQLFPENLDAGPDYFFLQFGEEFFPTLLPLVMQLRRKGLQVGFYPEAHTKMAKQMKYADAIRAQRVVMLGPEELAHQQVKVKDMVTGAEQVVDVKTFIDHA